jgi:hypothetical protein
MSIALQAPGSIDRVVTAKPPAKAMAIAGIPVYVYAVSLASLLVILGIIWDISWHTTIGRDKLLSPPHLLIYLGAVFGGLFSGIQVLWNTFKADASAKSGLVKVWGFFYSSLGALFCIWGAIAMLTSAPFDDWWHNTYGLDVEILSPPHSILALGMIFLQFGACVGVSKYLNQANAKTSPRQVFILRLLFVVAAASLLTMICTILSEFMDTRSQRGGLFYIIATSSVLLFLPALGRALNMRWGMTLISIGYFVILAGTNWILQIFHAEPLLGPIQNHVTHFQPLQFPILLFIPAMAMDTVLYRVKANDWIKSFLLSIVFISLLALVQYPLSGFLLESPAARNWFFGSHSWYYGATPDWEYRYKFAPWELQSFGSLLMQMGIALAIGTLISGRIGLRWGKWLGMVKR